MTDYQAFYRSQPPTEHDQDIFHRVAVEGMTVVEIADELSQSSGDIESIVRRVQRWLALEQLRQDPHLVKAMHLRRLEYQWQVVMEAWYQSQKPSTTMKIARDKEGKQKIEHTHRPQTGDVRYLDQARKIMAEIRVLYGAQGPIEHIEEEMPNVGALTPDQRAVELVARLETLRQRQRMESD